ncbi:MAG TPA: trypsin-like peptidase domain-containing protein [Ktedonobacteraceae bacterium]|nr:trypsin-like peptidase domain-containing protein [Ktedonobacteraceae bacterium]
MMRDPYEDHEEPVPYSDNAGKANNPGNAEQGQVAGEHSSGQGQGWTPDQTAGWQSPSWYESTSRPPQPQQPSGQVPSGTWQAPNNYSTQPGQMPGPAMTGPNSPRPRRSGGARAGAILLLVVLLILIFGIGLFAGWQFGRTSAAPGTGSTGTLEPGATPAATVPALTGNNIEAVREAVIAKVEPAVVQVNVTTPNGGAIGSGVIIDRRGYIVTNNHVVSSAQSIQVVLSNGKKLTAQLTGTDPADDLAIIKINPPANMAVATIGDSSKLQVGQDVLVIGNPLGITESVTNGIISALNRTVSEGQGGSTIPNAIQTDAPINPGNSGGALVDMQGNLIGIPTLTLVDPEFNTPANGIGFAIPSNRVSFIAPQIIATGHVTHTGRAALGVEVVSVDPTLAAQDNLSVNSGALIVNVVSGGAAASAGLQAGDVIVGIDNTQITDTNTLGSVLANHNPGDTVAVHIYRGSQQKTINVKLGELQPGS